MINLLIFYNFLCFGLTTSVIIPCHWKHFDNLSKLIKSYEEQSYLPNEIIIVISEFQKIGINKIDKLKAIKYKFPVKFILINDISYAGQNRNIGPENSIGDILIYNDADDIPDIKRIEYINYYFENYDIDYLLHSHNFGAGSLDLIFKSNPELKGLFNEKNRDVETISSTDFRYLLDCKDVFGNIPYHFGNCAISKKLFDQIQWPNTKRGQDYEYFLSICESNFKIFIIDAPLIEYRLTDSSLHRTP
jgi:hypothetical protein